jgi:hypothetical protein
MEYRFEVAFSFAGPHREKVRAIAELVATKLGREKVFFDEWYEHEILGSDMDVLLQRIYHEQSLMVVADLSEHYAGREWTQAEARAIRALRKKLDLARNEVSRLRLLNIRFDEGDVPGMFDTEGYLDGIKKTIEECAETILKRHALLVERVSAKPASTPAVPVSPSPPIPVSPSPTLPPAPPICFFHLATDDDLYSGRERDLDWLDACARDPGIRIVTITGIGGLGKTSLVGRWIKVRNSSKHRAFRGIFFYSFYSDLKSEHFFKAFLDFAYQTLGQKRPPKEGALHHDTATLAQRWPFLIVLDGLEVLQADAENSRYGWINDIALNEFVSRVGEKGQSLLVLTSRFPFPQVTRQFPERCRSRELAMFSPEEGADLLEKCRLPDDRVARTGFSAQFGGHPLALRLFAGASLTAPATPPAELSREVMRAERSSTLPDPRERGITEEECQRRHQRRQFHKLLEWLQAKLPAPKRRLLQLVALFREPVPTSTLVALATNLDAMKADFHDCDPARIRTLLDALVCQYLLQREDDSGSDIARWAAHPIVRDVFRAEALKAGETLAAQFAEIVAGKGEGEPPKNVAELQPILEAIEVLLAAGDFKAARGLWRKRLDRGHAFQWILAPQEGLRCARGFLEPSERRAAMERALGPGKVAAFLTIVGRFGSLIGELDGVEHAHEESARIQHGQSDWNRVARDFRHIADAQILRGDLKAAVSSASESVYYAGVFEAQTTNRSGQCFPERPSDPPQHEADQEIKSRALRAHAHSLQGALCAASRDFACADAIQRSLWPERHPLCSLRGILWCRHRLRLDEATAARHLTELNWTLLKPLGANHNCARCDLLLGELDLEAGDLESAARRICEAVQVFREGHQVKDLPDALLAQARLRGSIEDCEEALRLAARSGFALMQCDALNVRALLRREAGQPADAAKHAREALEIAERCGYYWGRHEALRQLRDAAKALGNRADEKHWDEAEKALAAKMQPEIEEALRINREHDEEMERLYEKPKLQG